MEEATGLEGILRRLVREELTAQLAPIRERLERPRGALRIDEAAAYLGYGETTIRQMIRDGELTPIRGPSTRIAIVELDRWIEEHSQPAERVG